MADLDAVIRQFEAQHGPLTVAGHLATVRTLTQHLDELRPAIEQALDAARPAITGTAAFLALHRHELDAFTLLARTLAAGTTEESSES